MTDLRKAAQQALEALESDNPYIRQLAANALRNTLEQPVQEPVGEVVKINNDGFKCEFNQRLAVGTKLYTAPPAAQPAQEPVAWRFKDPKDGHWLYTTHVVDLSKKLAA